jgi:hypothetical protein
MIIDCSETFNVARYLLFGKQYMAFEKATRNAGLRQQVAKKSSLLSPLNQHGHLKKYLSCILP